MSAIKNISALLIIFLVPLNIYATTYLADHFDMDSDTSITAANQITSESTGSWVNFAADQGCAAAINSTAGHSGRGFRWSWANGTGTTQEGNISLNASTITISYPSSMYIGFWWRKSITTAGSGGNDHLKMLRLYEGASTYSILPEILLSNGQWNNYYGHDSYNHLLNLYIADTDWHYFIFEFRGASTASGTDGIHRIYIDSTTEADYESTTINWSEPDSGTGNNAIDFRTMQGNLSGDWSGGTFTTDWDDFIVSDSKDEVATFLGISASPAVSGNGVGGNGVSNSGGG